MKSPEEEADSELGKRLREKFEAYKVPGEDRTRKSIFAALDKSPDRLHWIPLISGLFLIAAFFLFFLIKMPTSFGKKESTVSTINKLGKTPRTQAKPNLKTARGTVSKDNSQQKYVDPVSRNNGIEFKNRRTSQKQGVKIDDKHKSTNEFLLVKGYAVSIPDSKKVLQIDIEEPVSGQTDVQPGYDRPTHASEHFTELAFLSPIDSVTMPISLHPLTVLPVWSKTIKEASIKPAVVYGVKGVFSASIMQTFQLVNLSPSADDHVQNLQFVPLLSSKLLSYKLTAGIEKKHTQLLLNYTYLRTWNKYEIGTDKVIATRVGANQYRMTILGESHVEDERLHLLGIGLRQRLMIPQNILRNYSINLGMDYTRLMAQGQNLVWGTIGFYKNLYKSDGTRFDVGPYLQYSFTERESSGQLWRSRAYQVGISLGVKMK